MAWTTPPLRDGSPQASRKLKTRKKIVAHVLPWAVIGGTELATLRIAQAVKAHGIDSVMFCPNSSPEFVSYFTSQGFETETYDASAFEKGGLRQRIRERLRLVRAFRRRRVDIVHCAELCAGDHAALAAKLAGKKLICHVRNRYDWLTHAQRGWLLLCDRIVFVSKHTMRNFGHQARQAGHARIHRNSRVVYDGFTAQATVSQADGADVRQSVRAELGLPAASRLICMIARLATQKDHLTLIRAMPEVVSAHPDAYLLLVGGPGQTDRELQHRDLVLDAIEVSAARKWIVYAGFRQDVPRLLDAIDIFVLSTHFEGLPLVILEALAHGRPVVATAVDGIPEVVIDGRTGLLFAHEDASELAGRLNRLLSDERLADRLGRQGKAFVDEEFSNEGFARSMTRLYAEVS